MYSCPDLEPVCYSMFSSNCCFLTCVQISQEVGQVVWYSHLLKNFPQFFVIHIVIGFGIANKTEVDVFLQLSCFFYDATYVGNLISAFSKSSLNIRKFTVHILLKPDLNDFEHYPSQGKTKSYTLCENYLKMYNGLKYKTWSYKTFRRKHKRKSLGSWSRQRVLRLDIKVQFIKGEKNDVLDVIRITTCAL